MPANRHFYYLSLTYRLPLACLLTYSGTDVFTRTHTVLRTKNIRKCMPVFNTTRKRFSTSPITSETFSCALRIMVRFPLAGNNTISSAAFYKTAYVVYRISEKNSYFMGKSLLLQALFRTLIYSSTLPFAGYPYFPRNSIDSGALSCFSAHFFCMPSLKHAFYTHISTPSISQYRSVLCSFFSARYIHSLGSTWPKEAIFALFIPANAGAQ